MPYIPPPPPGPASPCSWIGLGQREAQVDHELLFNHAEHFTVLRFKELKTKRSSFDKNESSAFLHALHCPLAHALGLL